MNDLVATLKTMFRNCMDNAAKVTSEGGSLEYMQDVGAENSARHAIEAVCEDLEAYANGAVSINPQHWLTAKRREISRP